MGVAGHSVVDRWAKLEAARAVRDAMARFDEAELVALGDSAPVGLFVSTAAEGVVLANRRLFEITGQPLERLLGLGWLDSVHPDDRS